MTRRVLLILIAFFTCGIYATSFDAKPLPSVCADEQCVAIIDAGSTGSRIHLFAFDTNEQHELTNIHQVYSNKIEPGLATILLNQAKIDSYFQKLMSHVPKQKLPVYVYATAGMRLRNSDDQQHYYTMIQHWFELHPQWKLQDARTITGMEEGTFGWLALNYYLKTLDKGVNKPFANLIEVGGASAQIAFPMSDASGIDPNDLQELTINDHHILLFAHGFLGLGANEIYNTSKNQEACFPVGFPLDNGGLAVGNADVCQARMSDMLNDRYHVTELTQQALRKDSGDQWYTVSAVSSMITREPFLFSEGAFTAQELLYQADTQLCQQDYESLVTRYAHNDYIQRNCLIASYFYGLLVHGYKFSPNQDIHYLPNYDADWTIGVLLYQSAHHEANFNQ